LAEDAVMDLRAGGGATALSLEGLPRLPHDSLAMTRALARTRARLAVEAAVPLRRLGLVTVRPTSVRFAGFDDPPGVSFALDIQGTQARLTIDPPLVLRLSAAVLGLPPPRVLREVGRAERGVVAAVVVAFLEAVRAEGVRVGLDEGGPIELPGLAVELSIRAGQLIGPARLELPETSFAAWPLGPMLADPRLLAPLLVVELARTTLPAAAFATAVPGDVVVFDGTPPAAPDGPWPIQIRFGASCAGRLDPDGTVRRRGPLERQESETTMSSEDSNITAPVPMLAVSAEAAQALAAAPVEIVAEVGRLTVRGDELVGLIEGGVLALGPRRPAQVVLRVGGRIWAQGELVAVDDQLAVRITTLVR
jgi:flagellar motor switch/type III secretory pathway protein FliN